MPKVKLDIGATVNFLDKDELDDSLKKNHERELSAERERLQGLKYMRPPRIQGTVFSGTVGGSSGGLAPGTASIGGPPWGPQSGYAWSVRRICVGGLSLAGGNGTGADIVGIFRNSINNPPIAVISANSPMVNFNTMGCVLLGGDSLVFGNITNQASGNTNGTLASTSTYLIADFDAISVPSEFVGKLA